MKAPLSYAPLFIPTVALCLGIVAQRYIGWAFPLLCPALTLISVALFRFRPYLSAIIVTIAVGILCGRAHTPESTISDNTYHTGTVERISEATMSARAIVKLDNGSRCYLIIPSRFHAPHPGQIISFSGSLEVPYSRKDYHGQTGLDNFYYRNYISSTCVADDISVSGEAGGLKWSAFHINEAIIDRIISSGLSDRSKEFLGAIIAGDNSLMPEEQRASLSGAGLAHILALSGLHIGILTMIIGIMMLPLVWVEADRLRITIIILLLWSFAFITGLSPSVTRAVIMVTVVLAGHLLNRYTATFNSLCFAAFAILVFDPRALFAPGFQLTVMGVAAICLISRALPAINTRSTILRAVVAWLIVSMAAMIGTSMLAVYYLHKFPVYFLISNIPASLLLPPLFLFGLLLIAAIAIGLPCGLLERCIDFVCNAIIHTADFSNSLPGSTIEHIYIPWWSVMLGYTIIALIFVAIYLREHVLFAVSMVAGVLMIIAGVTGLAPSPALFIARNSVSSTIVIADGHDIKAYTTASKSDSAAAISSLPKNYPDFFGSRKMSAAMPLNATDSGYGWAKAKNILKTRTATIAVVNGYDDLEKTSEKVNYLLVGGRYRGTIDTLISTFNPDTILFGTDVNAKRLKRYIAATDTLQCPYRSLRENEGLHLPL